MSAWIVRLVLAFASETATVWLYRVLAIVAGILLGLVLYQWSGRL